MIKQPVPEIVRILSETLTSFDMYYVANRQLPMTEVMGLQ